MVDDWSCIVGVREQHLFIQRCLRLLVMLRIPIGVLQQSASIVSGVISVTQWEPSWPAS
jgi:hypothetical protein